MTTKREVLDKKCSEASERLKCEQFVARPAQWFPLLLLATKTVGRGADGVRNIELNVIITLRAKLRSVL